MKIALLSPCAESMPPIAVEYLLAAVASAWKHGLEVEQFGITSRMLVHSARNELARGFLKTECEWAFWCDVDQVIPPTTITHLVQVAGETRSKFVTGIYYQRQAEHGAVLWKKDPIDLAGIPIPYNAAKDRMSAYRHHAIVPDPNAKRPFKADVCGFGCVLTHREMFEKIPYPWFKMISDVCSEDFYFCVEAKKAGYQLWAAPALRVGHIGEPKIVFAEDMKIKREHLKPIRVEV